ALARRGGPRRAGLDRRRPRGGHRRRRDPDRRRHRGTYDRAVRALRRDGDRPGRPRPRPPAVREERMKIWAFARGVATLVVLALLVSFAWTLNEYATRTLTRILIIGLLAVSVALMTGLAGLPTLGQTAPYLVGAYTTATLVQHDVDLGIVQLLAA